MNKKMLFASGLMIATALSSAIAAQNDTVGSNGPDGISSDSKKVYFQSWVQGADGKFSSQHFSVDLNGENIQREGRVGKNIGWPAFTKDGMRAVYHTRINGNAELMLVDMAEPNNLNEFSNIKRLTFDKEADFFAAWSPDETQIAFYSWRTDVAQIFVMNADGSNIRNLSNNTARESDPTWSVKGEITFESHVSGNADVWVMNGDGTGRRNLTNHPSEDSWGAWSPDGERIVFSSDRDGDHDLYVMNRDGSNLQQITNQPGIDHWPRWAPDGSFISFSREIDDKASVFIIKPDGTGEKQLTTRQSYHVK